MKKATGARAHRVYERELPGRGFVAIEVRREQPLFRRRRYHGAVVVERRAIRRRDGAEPPVIAEERGRSLAEVVNRLLPAAQYDPAIGAALLRWHRT